jgi:DNA-binding CsgD family transcriptional regulator
MDFEQTAAFIWGLSAIETSREVGLAFTDLIAPAGFFASCCGCGRETASGPVWEFSFNTWPSEWLSIYREKDYVRHDPAPITARLTSQPFSWREISEGREWTPKQREFQNWLREIGVVDGFIVPTHEPGGDVGLCVSLSDHRIEDAEERLLLHMASLRAYQRCRELGGFIGASVAKAPLTTRELECLRWVVKGKSDRDIGEILDISHTTVHFHIEGVKRKLGVKTRTQAAGLIVAMGYI